MFVYLKCVIYFFRSNEDSFLRGVVSEGSYNNGNKRRLVSLKICFMSWMYEFIGVVFTLFAPPLKDLGFYYLYFPDAILMFVIIPSIHIMNDEDTKAEEGWIQGIRYMLKIRNQVEPLAVVPVVQAEAANQK
jgi:hypothetical protein